LTYVAPTFLDGVAYAASYWQALADEVARMSPVVSATIPQVAFSTSPSSAIGTTITAVLTLTNCVFSAGRAYSVENIGGCFADVQGRYADFAVFKTSTAGTQYGAFYRTPQVGNNGKQTNCYGKLYLRRSASTDLTTTIVLTVVADAGTVTHDAASTRPRALVVTDVGPASVFPSAFDVT
jgi:hypothetical protein